MIKMKNKFALLGALTAAAALALTSADAAIVWNLNPNNQHQPVGSSTQTFSSGGFQITATGYNNNSGTGTTTGLFYKSAPDSDGATERGLGLANSPHNELNAGPNAGSPLNFIQLDLTSILAANAMNGMISVGSLQNGEGFQLFGSNTQGMLGTAIAGPFTGLSFDNMFVAVPSFGSFQYISVAAATGNVLPVAFSAEINPIPEMGMVMPIVGLITAIGATSFLRRRRLAQMKL